MLPLLVSMEKYEHEKAVQIDCIIHSGGMEIHKSMYEWIAQYISSWRDYFIMKN